MKFARQFQDAIANDFPEWEESAVPYKQLKKLIQKLEMELNNLGIDLATLSQPQLSSDQPPQCSRRGSSALAFKYDLDGDQDDLRSKLTIYFLVKDGVIIDATLSAQTEDNLSVNGSDIACGESRAGQSLECQVPGRYATLYTYLPLLDGFRR
jgi:E3 ubiquitin-protein ligase BAH